MVDDALIKDRENAVIILKQVLESQISPAEARDKWPDYVGDSLLDSAFHFLYHFEDDEDIREKDSKYADWQIGQLREIVESIEKGTSGTSVNK